MMNDLNDKVIECAQCFLDYLKKKDDSTYHKFTSLFEKLTQEEMIEVVNYANSKLELDNNKANRR